MGKREREGGRKIQTFVCLWGGGTRGREVGRDRHVGGCGRKRGREVETRRVLYLSFPDQFDVRSFLGYPPRSPSPVSSLVYHSILSSDP